MKAEIGRLYHYPAAKKYYFITNYLEKGLEKLKMVGPIYEVIDLEKPDFISYAAKVTVEQEWTIVENSGSY